MSDKDSSSTTTTPPCDSIHPVSEASYPPKVTPYSAPDIMLKSKRGRPPAPTTARRKIEPPPEPSFQPQIDDEEYAKFVESLNLDITLLGDDDEEFKLTDAESDEDDDDEEDDDDDGENDQDGTPTTQSSPHAKVSDLTSPLPLPDIGTEFYSELEAELGSLLEEDLEAAVTTLLGTSQHLSPAPNKAKDMLKKAPSTPAMASPRTPLKEAARAKQTVTTKAQVEQLTSLMKQHYQLLIQQAVLSVRAAHGLKYSKPKTTNDMYCTETHEDLAEILDGAIGMLQDLDQNRKDAIRTSIQLDNNGQFSKRSLMSAIEPEGYRRLTRAAFSRTLQTGHKIKSTCFDVKGLNQLSSTFNTLDKSSGTNMNILDPAEHGEACKLLLDNAGAEVDESAIPGFVDVSTVLSDPTEFFGTNFNGECATAQNVALRKDRIQFTAAEDNLVLRGVNLYGEKQWILIADRYLPDRSINVIAQRYSKLSILVFRAHGIKVDAEGNLEVPPKHEDVDKVDPKKVEALKRVAPPAILNVHRWSIEEDLTLLRAVPVMGHMWAELSTRLMPHRDRGHLRKRYQVLERRVKATINRAQREDGAGSKPPKPPKQVTIKVVPQRPVTTLLPPKFPDSSFQLSTEVPGKPVPGMKKRKVPGPPYFLLRPPAASPGMNGNRPTIPNVAPKTKRKPGYNLPVRSPRGTTQPTTEDSVSGFHLDFPMDALQNDNNTRIGFEAILNEASNEWSQMSRVKEMMENYSESMIATSIANTLSREMPQLGIHVSHSRSGFNDDLGAENDNGSSSGLRIEFGSDQRTTFTSPAKRRLCGPLMSSVIEHSQKRMKVGGPGDSPENHSRCDNKTEMAIDVSVRSPMTPLRGPPGPPFGFSKLSLSPGLKTGFSSLPPALRPGFSPGGNSFLMAGNNGASMDGFEYCNFDISEESRNTFGDGKNGGTPLKNFPTMPPPSLGHPLTPSRALFHDANSLLASDFDAITALNSLSNSPGRSMLRRSFSRNVPVPEEKPQQKKSLFARVVGGVEEKQKKKNSSGQC